MASVSPSAARMPLPQPASSSSSQVVMGFHHPSSCFLKVKASALPLPLNFRFKHTVRLQTRQSSFSTFASNSNPSGGDSIQYQDKPDGTRTIDTDAGQGPPVLTILAGLLLFLLICWILVSILVWLIGLFVPK